MSSQTNQTPGTLSDPEPNRQTEVDDPPKTLPPVKEEKKPDPKKS